MLTKTHPARARLAHLELSVKTALSAVCAVTDLCLLTVAPALPWQLLCVLQIPMLLLSNVMKGNPWTKVDVNIGKIAELYGD